MVASKLNKLIFLLISISVCFGCNEFQKNKVEPESDFNIELNQCKKNQFVAQSYYKILLNQYKLTEIVDLKVSILTKGKNRNINYQLSQSKEYISFVDEKIQVSDTIQIKLKEDVYYIHNFQNDFWLGYKPNVCYLANYNINDKAYKEIREKNFGEKYSNSSPSIKEFKLRKEDFTK